MFPFHRFLVPAIPLIVVFAVRGCVDAYQVNRYAGVFVSLLVPLAVSSYLYGTTNSAITYAALIMGGVWLVSLGAGRWSPLLAAVIGLAAFGTYLWKADPPRFEALTRTPGRNIAIARTHEQLGNFEKMGKRRAELLKPHETRIRLVATGAIGSFGYYSRLPILDIYGLVDPTIARSTDETITNVRKRPGHQHSNAAYIFRRKPDYILIPRCGDRHSFRTPAPIAICEHPELKQQYSWDKQVKGYVRKPEWTGSQRPADRRSPTRS